MLVPFGLLVPCLQRSCAIDYPPQASGQEVQKIADGHQYENRGKGELNGLGDHVRECSSGFRLRKRGSDRSCDQAATFGRKTHRFDAAGQSTLTGADLLSVHRNICIARDDQQRTRIIRRQRGIRQPVQPVE